MQGASPIACIEKSCVGHEVGLWGVARQQSRGRVQGSQKAGIQKVAEQCGLAADASRCCGHGHCLASRVGVIALIDGLVLRLLGAVAQAAAAAGRAGGRGAGAALGHEKAGCSLQAGSMVEISLQCLRRPHAGRLPGLRQRLQLAEVGLAEGADRLGHLVLGHVELQAGADKRQGGCLQAACQAHSLCTAR